MKLLAVFASLATAQITPVSKVITMLSDLEKKIIGEGENAQKLFKEFSAFCEDRAKNLEYEIKTGQAESDRLRAEITDQGATAESLTAKIEQLSGAIAVDEADLAAANKIREAESKEFQSLQDSLSSDIAMLQKAIDILEREMKKGGSSMLQLQNAQSFADAIRVLVDASAISSADAGKLSALVQTRSKEEDEDEDFGAPAAAVYKSHSKNIVEVLEGLLDDATNQLSKARKDEENNLHNFQLMKQSLEDEIKFGNADKDAAVKQRAAASEGKANAEGDLKVATGELNADGNTLSTLHQDCMTRAEDFEAETKSRGEELKALAEAKKALTDNTGSANSLTYGASFLQTARSSLLSKADLANFEAVRIVRDLARKDNNVILEQLADRMSNAMHQGTMTGEDPFAKVKGLISDMIARLESEAGADANKKAYCDKELRETNEKKDAKTSEISKQTTRIDSMSSRSNILKQEVANLQKALADLAASQAEMDRMRKSENSNFVNEKADLESGLEGVKLALKILREYYGSADHAHSVSGSGTGIISLLEVIESDFSKNLAEEVSAEESAARAYDRQTKDNQVERTSTQSSVDYKTKEFNNLDKDAAELTTDREGVQAELDAVSQYLAKILEECTERAETYDARKSRFASEIAGLKEALDILERETALVQKKTLRRRVRSLRASA